MVVTVLVFLGKIESSYRNDERTRKLENILVTAGFDRFAVAAAVVVALFHYCCYVIYDCGYDDDACDAFHSALSI